MRGERERFHWGWRSHESERHLSHRFERPFARLEFYAEEPVVVHFFAVEPALERFAVRRVPFHEHFAVLKIHLDVERAEAGGLAKKLDELCGALSRQTG
jgi:hypothetical protein